MRTKAEEVGYELMKFTKQDKDIKKQIAKDTVDTIKQQKEEEKEKEILKLKKMYLQKIGGMMF